MTLGDKLPEFELLDKDGKTFSYKDLEGKAAVIYFYPMDETRGCTAQACAFRDAYQDFQDVGAEVVGISSDSAEKHDKFASNHNLPFVLLSDPNKAARALFGVKGNLLGLVPGRETFVFDKAGLLIHKFRSQMNWTGHVEESLKKLKKA